LISKRNSLNFGFVYRAVLVVLFGCWFGEFS